MCKNLRLAAALVFLAWTPVLALAGEAKIEGLVSGGGVLQLSLNGKPLCGFNIGLFEKGWKMDAATSDLKTPPQDAPARAFKIKTSTGVIINGEALIAHAGGGIAAQYKFIPAADVELNTLHVSADFPTAALAGREWSADGTDFHGQFPKDFTDSFILNNRIKSLALELAEGETLKFAFNEPTQVLMQDNRKWGDNTFSVRIGSQGNVRLYKQGQSVQFGFTLTAKGELPVTIDKPVTIVAGPEWIPLKLEQDIEPGSALDFSGFGFQDAPAGSHGRVIARPDGQFAFEKDPGVPRRFYGVNFCFSANYLAHEESDKLAERLMRLGYNAVRIHHYEGELVKDQPSSVTLNPQKLEELDYLLAALAKRGIYITTDLFVSRPVKWKDLGFSQPGNVPMDTFKILVPVVLTAFDNWKAFSRTLLEHVNPYTHLRYADDPALAWLSMINEGNYGNYLGAIRQVAEWNMEWNAWLRGKYHTRDALAAAWGAELKAEEDFSQTPLILPENIYNNSPRTLDTIAFLSGVERATILKMEAFLHELGCQALVTNANSWTNHTSDQLARAAYNYVDDHFYIDHPQFIERPWQLPSRCGNSSPVAGGASGSTHTAFTRLLDKPFTITEFNYSAPGRYRGVGGILTGALGALQGWGGIWRFAYSHSRENLFQPARLDYFNMACDPLGQAAERASLCLFLRGDLKAAPHCAAIVLPEGAAAESKNIKKLAPPWQWLAWLTRVGTYVSNDKSAAGTFGLHIGESGKAALSAATLAEGVEPYAASAEALLRLLKERGVLAKDNPSDPEKGIFRSETGEISINAPEDTLVLDTPKTAGGYAPAGKTIATAEKSVAIAIMDTPATVWLSALDNLPLSESKRILATHLTDLQNTEIKYAEKARQTLLDWGHLPHLVRTGKAVVRLRHANAEKLKVWALSTGGKRLAEVKTTAAGGVLEFTVDVAAGAQADGARMLYEIVQP